MKRFWYAAVLAIVFCCCKQSKNESGRQAANETEKNIYRCADSMIDAFKRKDWPTFVKYNHPNLVKIVGGPEAFASFINLQMKQIPDSVVKNIEIGRVLQVVKTPKDEQCLVEQNMRLQSAGVTFSKTTYLIGESVNSGKNWTFFDVSTNSRLTPKHIKPDISKELIIPDKKTVVE
jgi:hypothetical protein